MENHQLFKGTGKLTRLLLRQNRFKMIFWLLGIIGVTLSVAHVYPTVYTTQEQVQGFALTMSNPAMTAMLGANYPLESYNMGAVFSSEMLLFTAIAAAVMNSLFVASSTRDDEEEGRLEMIRALPVGRLAYLTASVVVILLINSALVLFTSIGLGMVEASGFTWEAAFLYGSLLGATGVFFAGLTALLAQLSETARGTIGAAMAVLMIAYVIRAIGDVQNEVLSLLSPLGWVVRAQVFVVNDWWPIAALLLGGAACLLTALYLNVKRDINAGLLPERKGRLQASRFLRTPIGLAWYLEKNSLIGWTVVLFLLSAAFGAILGELETFFSDMDIIQAYFVEDSSSVLQDQFIALLLRIMAVFTAVPAIATVLKLKKEERLGRTENYYSRSVSRNKLFGSYYLLSLLSTIIMQMTIGFGLYLTGNQAVEEGLEGSIILEAVLVYVPALWLMIGLAALLIGVFPKGSSLAWLYIAFSLMVVYVGDLLSFPDWLNNASSYTHVPQIPIEEVNWGNLLGLSAIAILFTAIGFVGYNKRDIESQ